MGITKKILFIFILLFLVITVLMSLLGWRSYTNLESAVLNAISRTEAQKIASIIQGNQRKILSVSQDWGQWDESYNFIKNKDQSFVDSNFKGGDTLINLTVDAMLFFNAQKELFYGRTLQNGREEELTKLTQKFEPIKEQLNKNISKTFIFLNDEGIIYNVAITPITPSKIENTQAIGSIVIIQAVTTDFFHLSKIKNVSIDAPNENLKNYTAVENNYNYFYKFSLKNNLLSTSLLLTQNTQAIAQITTVTNQYDVINTLKFIAYKSFIIALITIAIALLLIYWLFIHKNVQKMDLLSTKVADLPASPEGADSLPHFKEYALQRLVNSIKIMAITLSEQKKLFEGLLESMPAGVIIYQPNVVYANRYALEKLDTDKETLGALSPLDILDVSLSKEEKETYAAIINEHMNNNGELRTYETKLKLGNAKLEVIAVAETISYHEKPAGIITFVDISSLRKAESELSLLLKHSPVVIYHLTTTAQITTVHFVSDSILKLVGYSIGEITPSWWLNHLHPADQNIVLKKQEELELYKELHHTYRLRKKDGTYLWINDEVHRIKQEKDEVEIIGFWSDVTKQESAKYTSKALASINTMLLHAQNDKNIFEDICKILVEDGPFTFAWIGDVDKKNAQVTPIYHHGAEQGYLNDFFITLDPNSPTSQGPTGEVVRNNTLVSINPDTRDNKMMQPWMTEMLKRNFFASAAIQINTEDSRDNMIFNLYSDTPHMFDTQLITMLETLSNNISFALKHIKSINRLKFLSYHDSLCGLSNTNAFQLQLKTTQIPLSICVINIRDFSLINLNYGYTFGNKLLCQISQTIMQSINAADKLFHLGGDKFALLMSNTDKQSALHIAQCIKQKLSHGVVLQDHLVPIYLRMAIVSAPEDTVIPTSLHELGMSALGYGRKSQDVIVFEPWMLELSQTRMVLEKNITDAIQDESFEVYYQPIVNSANGSIEKCEALMRLKDKDGHPISPELLAKTAEGLGLISKITAIIVKKVLQQQKKWREQGIQQCVAINLAASDVNDKNFFRMIEELLLSNGLSSDAIALEITERTTIKNITTAQAFIKHARKLGIAIEIDDFGVAHSSLNEISALEFDYLKIDKSFIDKIGDDERSQKVVQVIIYLAKELNAYTIAEGVETPQQRDWLVSAGCDYLQGYLFSYPLPAAAYEEWLLKHTKSTTIAHS